MESTVEYQAQRPTQSTYQDVRLPDGTLVCRIDPQRMLVEYQIKRVRHVIDVRPIFEATLDKD